MELIMVGYLASHITDDVPFRCMVCERLTKHSHDDIISHLVGAHNFPKAGLSIDRDGGVFHTPQKSKFN
jgi:hypothetical protein